MTFMLSLYLLSNRKVATSSHKENPPKEQLFQQFEHITYTGQWSSNLDNSEGLMFTAVKSYEKSLEKFYYIQIVFYSGKWNSDPQSYLIAENMHLTIGNTGLYMYEQMINATLYGKNKQEFIGNITVVFENSSKKVTGQVVTENGELDFTFKAIEYTKEAQLLPKLYYAFLVTFCYLVSIVVLIKHLQKCIENVAFAEKTSLVTLGMMELYELGFGVWGLSTAFRVQIGFDYIFIACFWCLATFTFIHSRLIPVVYRAQNSTITSFGFQVSSRIIARFQAQFFLLCLVLIISTIVLQNYLIITLPLLHLMFLPQIITNSINGYKNSFSMPGVIAYMSSKIIIILYLFGCPKNFMNFEPNLKICWYIITVLLVQLGVLYWQMYRPRFLVPKRYRPMSYDYFRSKSEERSLADGNEITCIICMTPLNLGITTNEPIVNNAKTMHTPCSHRFHQDCLTQWMAIKMECPTCRSRLPIIDDSI